MNATTEIIESEPIAAGDMAVISAISKAELDTQITTARAFPRSLVKFRSECLSMATLTEDIAAGCIYALPRDGKTIEGPSARLAEIVVSAWGNCQAGTRIVDEGAEFITAQGVFFDLERNVRIVAEVRRRITDRHNRRYKPDMVAVTGAAACSIALRNAVFKGIPRAFWADIYEAARKAAVGDIKTIANKRADALAYLQKMGVTADMVFATLGVKGLEDIGADELATLRGLITSVKDDGIAIETAFAPKDEPESVGKPKTEAPKAKSAKKAAAEQPPASSEPPATSAGAQPSGLPQEQIEWLSRALGATGIREKALCDRFQVDTLAQIPAAEFEAARAWVINGGADQTK